MHHSTFVLALLLSSPLQAKTRQLWDSPAASVEQTVGITDVKISYHRPAVKGRAIWGKLVPFNEVWRAGANNATTVSFSTPVKVNGKALAAGVYALFVQPTDKKWTFIFSPDAEQWGAYFHNPERDVLRVEVPTAPTAHEEWLRYDLTPTSKDKLQLALTWEKVRASLDIEVESDRLYQAYLKDELARVQNASDDERWDLNFLVAKYWVLRGEQLDVALGYLDVAEKIRPSHWLYEYRGRALFQKKQTKEAIAQLDKAKAAATGKAPKEYILGLDKMKAEWAAGQR